nr:BTAD domain-containing putative transcriptional regulator [Lentzea sp. NBRC 105346]
MPLYGVKQRAVLGYLLLHAGEVVPVSRLLKVVWDGDAPPTARKMLQNAVSTLRGALSAESSALLLTQAPGYLLQVDPADLDVTAFQRLAERGRAELAAGEHEQAAKTLRDALGLWRGPALADLAERGVGWPELSALQDSKLAVYEDCFDAELARGGHQNVVGELEVLVETEPLRERLCAQLMRALYRCGRQVDALAVYRATRAALIEQLGVEPCRELQELERAILNHSPDLALRLEESSGEAPVAADPEPVESTVDVLVPVVERRWVSVLLVTSHLDSRERDDVEQVDQVHTGMADAVRAEVDRFGGMLVSGIGSTWWALFGVPSTREDDAERAVRAAVAIRDAFEADWPAPRCAVTTGEVLVTYHGDEPPSATGPVTRECWALGTTASPFDVRVCDVTRRASERAVMCSVPDDPASGWVVEAIRPRPVPRVTAPFVERERELDLLRGLLGNVLRYRRPHLVTVLGEPGMGKSRLLAELARVSGDGVRCLTGRAPAFGGGSALAEVVAAYAGVRDSDSPSTVDRRLADAVDRLMGASGAWVLDELRALLGPAADCEPMALRRFLEAVALERPLIVVVEDLHWASEAVLDFVGDLAERVVPVPMLVVATARPELLDRRPRWGGGTREATVTTLDRLSDDATLRLLGHLVETHGLIASPCRELVSSVGGNPLFATEYVRMLRDGGSGVGVHPPHSVRGVIAARLDTLPAVTKSVLQDAAVFGEAVSADAVAAVSDVDSAEVERQLEHLERWDFLRRSPHGWHRTQTRYRFGHMLVRDVAYGQLPRAVRAHKERLAERWSAAHELAES